MVDLDSFDYSLLFEGGVQLGISIGSIPILFFFFWLVANGLVFGSVLVFLFCRDLLQNALFFQWCFDILKAILWRHWCKLLSFWLIRCSLVSIHVKKHLMERRWLKVDITMWWGHYQCWSQFGKLFGRNLILGLIPQDLFWIFKVVREAVEVFRSWYFLIEFAYMFFTHKLPLE